MLYEVKSYIEDQKVENITKAAIMADEFELTHQHMSRGADRPNIFRSQVDMGAENSSLKSSVVAKGLRSDLPQLGSVCTKGPVWWWYYCGKKGHKKSECFAFQNRSKVSESSPKPNML